MLTPSLNTVMTRLLIVAAVLAALVFIAPAIFAQEGPIEYDENGTGPVITFTSTDPENGQAGAGIDWDVTGLDADDFIIDERGMLMFKSPPDYEMPTDRARAAMDLNDDNDQDDEGEAAITGDDRMYQITVRATEQMTSGSDPRALSTESRFTVQVMDVNEDGNITLNRIQPEVGTAITARLTDPDGPRGADGQGTVTWQWYVSKVTDPVVGFDSHWDTVGTNPDANNTDPTMSTYTPAGDRVTEADDSAMDEGKYLRAVAIYTDRHGQERKARVKSENTVRPEVTSDLDEVENPKNGSPGFSSTGNYKRSIAESEGKDSLVVDPVTAIDPNDEDILTYDLDNDMDATNVVAMTEIDGGNTYDTDVSFFSIDDETAQISLRKQLSFEASDGRDYEGDNADTAGTYKFYVRATDPSGETAQVEVTVTALDRNDAPEIMNSVAANNAGDFVGRTVAPAELTVNETADGTFTGAPDMGVRSLPGFKNVFTADDEDERYQTFWSLEGDDADEFDLTSSSPDPTTGLRGPGEPIALKFNNDPDYENPTDDNKDSVYKVTLVARDRFTGGLTDRRPLTIFVKNVQEDGGLTLDEDQPEIDSAVTASVSDPDNGVAVVTWRWERATSTSATTWEVIDGATTATYTPRKIDKGHDDEGYYLRAIATYTDIMSHDDDPDTVLVDERTQSGTDETPAARNPETATDNIYRVVKASANAVRVPPAPPGQVTMPVFAADSYELAVAENAETGSLVGYPVMIDAEDKGTFEYSLDDSVTGDDAYFTISTATGQIRVDSVAFPNPVPSEQSGEVPQDAGQTDPALNYEAKSSYSVIVTATDLSNDAREAMTEVTITLDNLNERPYFDKASRETADATITYSEHRTNAVIPMLAAVEPDGGELDWVLIGADAGDFEWEDVEDLDDGKDRIALKFKSQPNFEKGTGSATSTETNNSPGDTYSVTVRATEKAPIGAGPAVSLGEELMVTVRVADHDEPGSVELTWLQPEVGTEISASLSDVDAGVTGQNWTWYRSKATNPNPVTDPSDAAAIGLEWEETADNDNDADYTPVAADEGKFLLARVVYNDTPGGTGTENQNSAVGRSVNTVRKDVTDEMNNSPDFNASEATRSIDENAAVGDAVGLPVDVDRNEDFDTLTYVIVQSAVSAAGGNGSVVVADLPYFSIDKENGQLMVAQQLSAEETDGRTYTGQGATSTPGKYTIVVRAIDPSGEGDGEDRDDIVVNITANNVDEAPTISEGAAELPINEVNSTADDDDATKFVGLGYEVNDQGAVVMSDDNPNLYHRSEEDTIDRAIWPDPIGGPDGHLFEYSTPEDGIGRRIHFKIENQPDYESPQDANTDNVYELTVRVVDSDNLSGTKDVRITVNNVNEIGEVTLSPEQPNDGNPVMASVTDPDMVLSVTNWEWATTTDSTLTSFPAGTDDEDVIDGANMSQYTGKVGEFLWVRVSYRDGQSVTDDPVSVLDERNDNPATAQDVELDFDSDRIATSSTDYAVQPDEGKDDDDDGTSSGVVPFTLMVYENVPSTGYVGDPIPKLGSRDTIGGPDGATFVFAEMNDGPESTFYDSDTGGDDNFGLRDTQDNTATDNDKGGQLALNPVTHLDYESSKNSYVIEITNPEAETELSVYRVTINVMNVNEAPSAPSEHRGPLLPTNTDPMFAATSTSLSVDENAAAGTVVGMVMATDADRGDMIAYSLDDGADAGSFAIDSATGEITTTAMLDYETQPSYMVTVTATDDDEATDMIYVTIMVNNLGLDTSYDADESGTIDGTEVLNAVRDYFDDQITGSEVLEVVRLYFENV